MQITADHVIRFLQLVAERVKEQRDYLTKLDAAIGDADHGVNLDRGFSTVMSKLPTATDRSISGLLKLTGMTLISTVGGASGPLYGTAFLRAGTAIGDRATIGAEELIAALSAALDGIQTRGKATRGEKTMIDAIAPAIDTLKEQYAASGDLLVAMRAAVVACEQGMIATEPMLATKGRASYLGERSIGHRDPGAASAYLIAKALLETIERVAQG
ncbi:MAG: dihydroxyacetone kinase subunit L [Chloroflexus sp.]|jgi:dihydroxyacetone kinase-like protein|nr:dihydroxyacetone kinase subunit L [Chloroflexus sp.]MBO9338162.1 dihydroxyacetone kinase subunit L [Chloroflexus sp.]